ncbi:hypothetical protein EJ02DRAFT_446877 [Clathrospora elynae]|uniref:ribonuclease H n=1 Tax=Clathrospora elynae TaxID=706981 RepID=A0A6A5SIN0_9PLEO|nr:hypothetical protein EJ02DRAFT_446877 [Clathrospora elynae]
MAGTGPKTTTTSSGKRKRDTSTTFYAVKVGKEPGIHLSWPDASESIQGVTNPVYKKFSTLAEAEAFIRGASNTPAKLGKVKYYGVAVGHVPGVYTDYTSVQTQTKGCRGSKQKAFATQAEAQGYVDEFRRGSSAPISLRGDLSETSSIAASKMDQSVEPVPKRQKKDNAPPTMASDGIKYEPGMGPLPEKAEDGFDPTIKLHPDRGDIRAKTEEERNATKIQPTGDFSGPVVVYTDGSSLGNGRVGAVGGVGVYFGQNDARNISEALRGDRQTNQRAELTAVARALDHIPIDREALIITDSNYSIKCLTVWFLNWEKKNWRNSAGKPVENRDLIEPILARIREREMCRAKTNFKWVKGHGNDPGNVAADGLACQGSRSSTPQLRSAPETSPTLNTPTRKQHAVQTKLAMKREPQSNPDADHVDDGGDFDYDALFNDIDAEPSNQAVAGAPLPEYVVPPTVAAERPFRAGAQEGKKHLEQVTNGTLPEPEVNGVERRVHLQGKTDGVVKTIVTQEKIERE